MPHFDALLSSSTKRLLIAITLCAPLACDRTNIGAVDAGAVAADGGLSINDVGPARDGADNPHGTVHGAASRSLIAALADDAPILSVDGVVYKKRQLVSAITQSALAAGIPPAMVDDRAREAFEKPAYEKLIERQLLAGEAKKRGLYPTLDEAQAASKEDRERLIKTLPAGKTFADALKELGTDETTFQAELQSDVAVGRLLKSIDAGLPAPTDAALKKIYDDNAAMMVVATTASVSHILVKLDKDAPAADVKAALAKATALRAELKGKGRDAFMTKAQEVSDDASAKKTKGDLGTFQKGDLMPELEAAAFKLAPDTLSAPVRTARGYHVLYGQGVNIGHTRTFDEVKSALGQREHTKVLMQNVDTLIDTLRSAAKIERIVAPVASPFVDDGAATSAGSRVPGWKPSARNANKSLTNPHPR